MLANGDVILPGLGDGIPQIGEQPLPRHLHDAETGAPGRQFEIAIHAAAGVDNLQVFIDEDGGWSILAEQAAIELLLGFEIVPIGIGQFCGNAQGAVLLTFRGMIHGKSDGLRHHGGLLEENLAGAVLRGEQMGCRAHALRSSQKQIAARAERIVK